MAVIRKDYLKFGGHNWEIIIETMWSKYAKDNNVPTGISWHECKDCGRIANRSGNNGQCTPI